MQLLEKNAEVEQIKRQLQEHVLHDRARWRQLADHARYIEEVEDRERQEAEELAKKEEAGKKKRFWPFQSASSDAAADTTAATVNDSGESALHDSGRAPSDSDASSRGPNAKGTQSPQPLSPSRARSPSPSGSTSTTGAKPSSAHPSSHLAQAGPSYSSAPEGQEDGAGSVSTAADSGLTARTTIERQLADGRYKVRTLQERVFETLQPDKDRVQGPLAGAALPATAADGGSGGPNEAAQATPPQPDQAMSPRSHVESQLARALHLQQWLLGEGDDEDSNAPRQILRPFLVAWYQEYCKFQRWQDELSAAGQDQDGASGSNAGSKPKPRLKADAHSLWHHHMDAELVGRPAPCFCGAVCTVAAFGVRPCSLLS